jgi:hypothetical protein
MRVGLIGIRRSPDLCLLKKRVEDRGHQADFINLRGFPQYVLGWVGTSGIRFDHLELSSLDCFYLGEMETRNRFFRGVFGREIWIALRERYLDFAGCEPENQAFQMSLLLSLSGLKPFINSPTAFLRNRLRPAVLLRLARAGLPAMPVVLKGDNQAPASHRHRIRFEEEVMYDVPCFPRYLSGSLSIMGEAWDEEWKVLGIRGGRLAKMIVVESGRPTSASLSSDADSLTSKALGVLGLELAEIRMGHAAGRLVITDVRPAPGISEFEEVTGQDVSNTIATRLLSLGGSK